MNLPHIHELLREIVRAGAAPGAALALSVNGKRSIAATGVANFCDGTPLTPDSRFQLGCITKLLTAIVALELVNAGRLDLDASIGRYLPQFAASGAAERIRVRHLLSHTSGYQGLNVADPGVRYYYNWDKFLQLLRSDMSLFAPGTTFNYEHTEGVLLGAIAERATGTPISDLYRDMVFAPLGIHYGTARTDMAQPALCVADHSFDVSASRYVPLRAAPHCSFWDASLSDLTMTLADLLLLGEAVAGFRHPPVFSAQTIERLRAPEVHLPYTLGGTQREQVPFTFGFGCAQYGPAVFGHNGSARGQTCALRFDLASRAVLVTGMNCWRPHVRDMLCWKVINSLPGATPAATPAPPADWDFSDLPGCYTGAQGMSVEVTGESENLICSLRSSSPRATIRVVISRTADGATAIHSEAAHLSVGFFNEPVSGTRGVMLGLNVYRRGSALLPASDRACDAQSLLRCKDR